MELKRAGETGEGKREERREKREDMVGDDFLTQAGGFLV